MKVLYSKESKITLLNQSIIQLVAQAVDNTISMDEISRNNCIELLYTVIPEAVNIKVNPIRFDVITLNGTVPIVFKNGLFLEE